jgi:hypothetical protein
MREHRELQTLIDELERHIVAQDKQLQDAVLAEREACAALCYAEGKVRLAETIRARGEK